MEAFEGYWRKVPSVKRLVFKSIPEATTRVAMLKRGEVDIAYLLDALNLVTGNLDAPGGAVFGRPAIALDDVAERAGGATYGATRTRIGGFPDVVGNLPATLIGREIDDGQLRALFVSAGNPVLSVPDGDALERALARPARRASTRPSPLSCVSQQSFFAS